MTDRSNMVEMLLADRNVPTPLEETAFFLDDEGEVDIAAVARLAYLGQNASSYSREDAGGCDEETRNQQALTNCKVRWPRHPSSLTSEGH